MIIINTILIGGIKDVFALEDFHTKDFLESREKSWPQWVKVHSRYSDLKKDLIYPSWFEGNWLVKSESLNNSQEEPVYYKVNFHRDQFNNLIGSRSENAQSIGKALFGNRLIKVVSDPNSFNRQIVYLKNDEYIDSRIVDRTQTFDQDFFFSDELAIQTVHKEGISRINQVEVMSKFYKCNKYSNLSSELKDKICGIQYLATYGSKVGEINLRPVTTNKYYLSFEFIDDSH